MTTTANTTSDGFHWLGLAAAPTFTFMAMVSLFDGSQASICGSGPDPSPLGSMTTMYLLMALFHLAPWLKFARRR
ncbi:hypothetical protein [Shinella sp.]|uniref:hypothetical protein n=1 Tax=Shinella sp. TaxID=1870904 RepID=UPI0028A9EDA9|nr:hypothetical protein [Shinella sp.]